MRKWVVLALVVGLIGTVVTPALAQQKQIQMGPYMETLKPQDSIDVAIARGKKLFNQLGCAGCHPRGGTIGGTAVAVDGNRMPIPIPDLRGAALHYPRIAGTGFIATIGMLNDM